MSARTILLHDQLAGIKHIRFVLPLIIVLVTFATYFPVLNNEFLSDWDDGIYVVDNPNLKAVDSHRLASVLKQTFTDYSNGHYHPITNLVYAIEYKLFGMDPMAFHGVNLFIHLLNSVLIFFFVFQILKDYIIAFLTTILFAIHPMHVESVAWISDLKDLLCTLFYVAALYVYVKNYKSPNVHRNIKLWLFYLLALMSKAMAITLPLVLILFDFYTERKITKKSILSKLPMIFLSVVFTYVSILAQKSNDALGDMDAIPFYYRICFASYALMMYILKLLWFGDLSAFYNYPFLTEGKLPLIYYLSVLFPIILFFVIAKTKWNKYLLWFCAVFFVLTIFPVLQLVPAGNVIIADRYTYFPYLGLFIIISVFVSEMVQNWLMISSKVVLLIAIFFIAIAAYSSYSRTKVWNNSNTLWDDTINKNPQAALPYNNRGVLAFKKGDYDKALSDFNMVLQLNPKYVSAHYNRGLSLIRLNRFKESIQDFNYVLNNNPRDVVSVLMNRAYSNTNSGNYMDAIQDYTSVLKLNRNITDAYYFRGFNSFTINQFEPAIKDFGFAIQLDPKLAKAYYFRGLSYYKTQNYLSAYKDLNSAAKLGEKVDPFLINEISTKLNTPQSF